MFVCMVAFKYLINNDFLKKVGLRKLSNRVMNAMNVHSLLENRLENMTPIADPIWVLNILGYIPKNDFLLILHQK